MMETMTNRVAVITGGTRGLGRELAMAFHEESWLVAVNYLTSSEKAAELAGTMGDRVMLLKTDVSRADDVRSMAGKISCKWKNVDVLINNAGISVDSLLPRQKEDDWERVIDVNLRGAFNAIRAFAPLMSRGGHIVNISSYSGLKGNAGQSAYSASKAALLGLTKSAALELGEYDIRVNAVLPGYMPTEMGLASGGALNIARTAGLLNTLSDPGEVARFILYLVGTRNISGQVFCLDNRII